MNDQNLDINLIIQSFQEKASQMITEIVVKDATIKSLQQQLLALMNKADDFEIPTTTPKKDK